MEQNDSWEDCNLSAGEDILCRFTRTLHWIMPHFLELFKARWLQCFLPSLIFENSCVSRSRCIYRYDCLLTPWPYRQPTLACFTTYTLSLLILYAYVFSCISSLSAVRNHSLRLPAVSVWAFLLFF